MILSRLYQNRKYNFLHFFGPRSPLLDPHPPSVVYTMHIEAVDRSTALAHLYPDQDVLV